VDLEKEIFDDSSHEEKCKGYLEKIETIFRKETQ
jgi:hypothetical protein